MTSHALTARIPLWVRVAGIIALALVGVLVSAMLLDAADIGGRGGRGGHGSSETPMDGGGHGPGDSGDRGRPGGETDSGGHGSDDRGRRGGGHDSSDATSRSDRNGGQGGSAAPAGRDLAALSAQVVTIAMDDIVFMPAKAGARCGGRA